MLGDRHGAPMGPNDDKGGPEGVFVGVRPLTCLSAARSGA